MVKIKWKVLAVCFAIVLAVAFIGSSFTKNANSEWYNSIKPEITPQNYIFSVVWSILFFLIALSLYFVYTKTREKKKVILVFGVNFSLNILWSLLYFNFQDPFSAFIDLILLWFSTLSIMAFSRKVDKTAAWLLLPYLLWVTFAGVLNFLSIR